MFKRIREFGINSSVMYFAALASIGLSIFTWFRERDDDRSRAERFGIFIGLWAPTLMIMGRAIQDQEERDGAIVTS